MNNENDVDIIKVVKKTNRWPRFVGQVRSRRRTASRSASRTLISGIAVHSPCVLANLRDFRIDSAMNIFHTLRYIC
jgi:hypothetical protein